MAMRRNEFVGRWRITHMELWDREYLDLEVPAFIEFRQDQFGEFQFGVVRGFIDYRVSDSRTEPKLEFSWEGDSEGDALSGRGWAVLREGRLEGCFFIHQGDDSSFVAERASRRKEPRAKRRGGG